MSVFTKWRAPTREEYPHGMAELSKIIGERESVDPSWTRRLALVEGDKWALLVDECIGNLKCYDPNYATGYTVAYPLAEGAALLTGPKNPEVELARRRAEIQERKDQAARESAARVAAEKRQHEEEEQLIEDKRTYRADDWNRLADWQKMCIVLALKVESRDPELAADLRAVMQDGTHARPPALAFPRTKWWATS